MWHLEGTSHIQVDVRRLKSFVIELKRPTWNNFREKLRRVIWPQVLSPAEQRFCSTLSNRTADESESQ